MYGCLIPVSDMHRLRVAARYKIFRTLKAYDGQTRCKTGIVVLNGSQGIGATDFEISVIINSGLLKITDSLSRRRRCILYMGVVKGF